MVLTVRIPKEVFDFINADRGGLSAPVYILKLIQQRQAQTKGQLHGKQDIPEARQTT